MLSFVLMPGTFDFLFFIDYLDLEEGVREGYAGIGAVAIAGLIFHLYRKQKNMLTNRLELLRDALQVLRFNNFEGFHPEERIKDEDDDDYYEDCEDEEPIPFPALKGNNLDYNGQMKDIVLGLTLESKGILHKFEKTDRLLGSCEFSVCENQRKLAEILELNNYEDFNEELDRLNQIMLRKIGSGIPRKFPKQAYFLRLRMLKDFQYISCHSGYLIYEEQDFGDNKKVLFEFCKSVINEFYQNDEGYTPLPTTFSLKKLGKFFSDPNHDYRELGEFRSVDDIMEAVMPAE